MSKINTIFIDMDGTLVDSIPFLKRKFFEFISNSEEDFELFNGKSIEKILEEMNKKEISSKYYDSLLEYYKNEVKLHLGAYECVQYLKNIGKTLVLITSATKEITTACLNKIELTECFDFVFTSDPKISKPNPEFYLHALEKLKINANEAIAIEDSLNGVDASVGAGIFTFQIFNKGKDTKLLKHVDDWFFLLHDFTTLHEINDGQIFP